MNHIEKSTEKLNIYTNGVTIQQASKEEKDRITEQGLFQGNKLAHGLFVQSRQVATNTTKSPGSGYPAEAAGNLLLHFDYAQVALRLIAECLAP